MWVGTCDCIAAPVRVCQSGLAWGHGSTRVRVLGWLAGRWARCVALHICTLLRTWCAEFCDSCSTGAQQCMHCLQLACLLYCPSIICVVLHFTAAIPVPLCDGARRLCRAMGVGQHVPVAEAASVHQPGRCSLTLAAHCLDALLYGGCIGWAFHATPWC
jgi:hypothetical protein